MHAYSMMGMIEREEQGTEGIKREWKMEDNNKRIHKYVMRKKKKVVVWGFEEREEMFYKKRTNKEKHSSSNIDVEK